MAKKDLAQQCFDFEKGYSDVDKKTIDDRIEAIRLHLDEIDAPSLVREYLELLFKYCNNRSPFYASGIIQCALLTDKPDKLCLMAVGLYEKVFNEKYPI